MCVQGVDSMQVNCTLASLGLGRNEFGDEAAAFISDALKVVAKAA